MSRSTILQKFILNKLKDKLKLFFELEHSKIEGFTIKNLGMKPDLLQQLSQIIKVPLMLTSGSIESVSLNIPWESLLSTKKDQAIAVVISGIKISARLPNQLQRQYVIGRKKKIVEKFTQQFNKKATSRLTFLNKLKQYFFGTFCVEVKKLELEVSIQMKHSLISNLSVSYIKFQKDIKTDRTQFQMRDLCLGYRLSKESTIRENIINKADISLTGMKTETQDFDHLQSKNLEICFNNENFNDVIRIITLIKWHNSFVDIPQKLWSYKPNIIGQATPKSKLIYICNIIKFKTLENTKKQLLNTLRIRRQYIKLFQNFRRDPSNDIAKRQLNQFEERMEVWKVKEYRRFCILWAKKFPNICHRNVGKTGKKELGEPGKVGWLSFWFPKSVETQIKELQQCLDNTPTRIAKKHFNFNLQTLKISLNIRSHSGKQPFLNLLSYNNQIQSTKTPTLPPPTSPSTTFQSPTQISSQIEYKSNKKISIQRLLITYDRYLGHHEEHKYLLSQQIVKNGGVGNDQQCQDQFQDIQNVLECDIGDDHVDVRLLPVRFRVNDDTWEKLSVFKFERIHNTFQNAQKLILEENAFEEKQPNNKVDKSISVKSSVTITIPQNMCEKLTELIQLKLIGIAFNSLNNNKKVKINQCSLQALLQIPKTSQRPQLQFIPVHLFTTTLTLNHTPHSNLNQTHILFTPISINLSQMQHLKKLIRLISKLKPKQRNRKPLYKLKNLRRKQSIGQQFIDACQNLNQHLLRSATLSQRTRQEKYIVKRGVDGKVVVGVEGIRVKFQTSEVQLGQIEGTLFSFTDYKAISLQHEQKTLHINIYNIENLLHNIQQITKQLKRYSLLSEKSSSVPNFKQQSSKEDYFDNLDGEGNTMIITNFHAIFRVYYDNKLRLFLQANSILVDLMRDQALRAQLTLSLGYYKPNSLTKQHTIQPLKLQLSTKNKYNKSESILRIPTLHLNLKPSLLSQLAILFQKLQSPRTHSTIIKNKTVNSIYVGTKQNIYKQIKYRDSLACEGPSCGIVALNCKMEFGLGVEAGAEEFKVGDGLFIIKAVEREFEVGVESNFRIRNGQDKTVWVRVISGTEMVQMRKKQMRDTGIITFQHLSNAQMDIQDESIMRKTRNSMNKTLMGSKNLINMGNNRSVNLKRSTSLNDRVMGQYSNEDRDNVIENDDKDAYQQIPMKKVSIIKNFDNRNINPHAPTSSKMKPPPLNFDDQSCDYSDESPSRVSRQRSGTKSREIREEQPRIQFRQNKSMGGFLNQKIKMYPIPPEQTIQIILTNRQAYLQIVQLDERGTPIQTYVPQKISHMMQNNSQLLTKSNFFTQSDSDNSLYAQKGSTLVLATTVAYLPPCKPSSTNSPNAITSALPLYNIEILSPTVIVNKIPQEIRFKFHKEEVDMLQVALSAGRDIRKRSFQAVEVQKIDCFRVCKVNQMKYQDISQIQIIVGEYSKRFRLDHIIQNLPKDPNIDIRIQDLLCLNNGQHEIQTGIQLRILKQILKITVFPQFIIINMTSITLRLQIQQENYTYPPIKMNPIPVDSHYKDYINMSDQRFMDWNILRALFGEFQASLSMFTGAFQDVTRAVCYGDNHKFKPTQIFSSQMSTKSQPSQLYPPQINLTVRKLQIDDKPITLLLYMPTLFIINKSDFSFYLKTIPNSNSNANSQNKKNKQNPNHPKKLQKNCTQYILIDDTISIQSCEELEEIAFNQWMKISLAELGTIYYAKEMTSSSGYQSREYEIRKKRLKKAPKLFFRIVMAKYEYGYQILIEQSQYPPVTFINRCKSRIQICQTRQNIIEQMQYNQIAQYASKIPHHSPTFSISMVQNYEFKKYGKFSISSQASQNTTTTPIILQNRIKVIIEEYKDKQIVVFQDNFVEANEVKEQNKGRDGKGYGFSLSKINIGSAINASISAINLNASAIHNNVSVMKSQLLLEKLNRVVVSVGSIQVSILNNVNKQLSCACLKQLEFAHQTKNTKRYVKVSIDSIDVFSYNGLQPSYLFYCKQPTSNMTIGKKQVMQLFKRKKANQQSQINQSLSKSLSNSSLHAVGVGTNISAEINQRNSADTNHIFILDLTIDYHKHATILEKCKVFISQLVVTINANTIIDYIKYYYHDVKNMIHILDRYEAGRAVLKELGIGNKDQKAQIEQKRKQQEQYRNNRKNSKNINNINSIMKKHSLKSNQSLNSPKKQSKHQAQLHGSAPQQSSDPFNRSFIIQNFSWQGLKVSMKFQHLQNFQHFLSNKEIKYLIKFITWVGDLRPIEFSSTHVEYEQYTIYKLLQLVDVNKLVKELSETFLQYPLKQLYHVLSVVTKFVGFNDLQQSDEQRRTFKRIIKSIFHVGKKIISSTGNSTPMYIVNRNGEMVERKRYVDQFEEVSIQGESVLDRIMKFKYQEWRFNEDTKQNKLVLKNGRLERYSNPNILQPYDSSFSRIQTAINTKCGNKIFRQIKHLIQVNKYSLIGLTEDWFVIYITDKQQWMVIKPEDVLDLYLQKGKSIRGRLNKGRVEERLFVVISGQNEENKIQKMMFEEIYIGKGEVEVIEGMLAEMRLTAVF